MRLQAQLGGVQQGGRLDLDNQGKLSIGHVVKVYQKDNSADVVLLGNSYMGDDNVTDGKITCLQLQRCSGFDDKLQTAYGDVTPLAVGQMVVIGYIDSLKGKPVILGSLPMPDNALNNSPRQDAKGEFFGEREERIHVTRMQDFSYMNGTGEFEKGSNSRAFLVGKAEKVNDHREDGFNWENLTPKSKFSAKTIGLRKDQYFHQPFNYLMVTKNQYDDEGAMFNRLYHDAEWGITRFSKDTENSLFMVELDEDDNFEVRQQRDTPKREINKMEPEEYSKHTLRRSDDDIQIENMNDDPPKTYKDSEEYTKVKIADNGDVTIVYRDKDEATRVTVGKDGVDVKTTQELNIRSTKEIYMVAPHIYIHEGDPEITLDDITGDSDE